MTGQPSRNGHSPAPGPGMTPGRLAQTACLLEVAAPKPGNVHRFADLPGLHLVDFLLSATAITDSMNRAEAAGVGPTVLAAIEATRRVVHTNTNLGIVLLLAPLAAVPASVPLADGLVQVLAATTKEDARCVYRAIRLAQPGGLGAVPDQDVAGEPTVSLVEAMAMAHRRDLIARQYVNGFREVLVDGMSIMVESMAVGHSLETAIVAAHLQLLAREPDSLIERKYGPKAASEVTRRAAAVLEAGWPDREAGRNACGALDAWLRHPSNSYNPGTTADLVTAALYGALREGTIQLPVNFRVPE